MIAASATASEDWSSATAWLCLGHPALLTGRPLRSRDIAVLAQLSKPSPAVPPNIMLTRWNNTLATRLFSAALNGRRTEQLHDDATQVIVRDLQPAAGVIEAHRLRGTESDPVLAPLFLLLARPGTAHVYSREFLDLDLGYFIRITDEPLASDSITELQWLPEAITRHNHHGARLNSHNTAFCRAFPDWELEYKYRVESDVQPWPLAIDLLTAARHEPPPTFTTVYRDDFEAWDFQNNLYEVTAPVADRGYVSFIPTVDGSFIVKRKWFSKDADRRREKLTHNVRPESFEHYLSVTLGVAYRRLHPFRRIRYDITLESLTTGNRFSVMADRCSLIDRPDTTLSQIEIEYIGTRTVLPPIDSTVEAELQALGAWLEKHMDAHKISIHREKYSKLSWLRDVHHEHPPLERRSPSS